MRVNVGRIGVVLLAAMLCACSQEPQGTAVAPEGEWISLFNGKNLDGWLVKIRGRTLGDDPAQTFRAVDGILRVSYDNYKDFGTSNGMLIYGQPLTRYWLRAEYRFVGSQPPGAPAWAFRDSGIQFHGQPPASIATDQEFPVGLEINLIGGKLIGRSRPTGNVCTSGTRVHMNGSPLADKCSTTSGKTVRMADQWVRIEAKIDGDSIEHWINGVSVVQYTRPQLDEQDPLAKSLLAAGATTELEGGYLSLQSNGAPIEFRKIEILPITAP